MKEETITKTKTITITVEHRFRCKGVPSVGDTFVATNNWSQQKEWGSLSEAVKASAEAIMAWGPCAGLPWTPERGAGQAQIFVQDGKVVSVIP